MRPPTAPDDAGDIRYRLPRRAGGQRVGAHRGAAAGAGLEFLTHQRLFDRPDPRRLDLRASLADPRGDWLVRVNRLRTALTLRVLVDVSASMRFGAPPKLALVADFVAALGLSAFRSGDALGLLAFDAAVRDDLEVAPRHGRGVGEAMAALLRSCAGGRGDVAGLRDAALRVDARSALVFVVSDFLWPLAGLGGVLDGLGGAHVVPMVVVDAAELEAPAGGGLALLRDAETGRQRALWVRAALRTRWREAARARRAHLDAIFADRGLRPFTLQDAFDARALSEHLMADAA